MTSWCARLDSNQRPSGSENSDTQRGTAFPRHFLSLVHRLSPAGNCLKSLLQSGFAGFFRGGSQMVVKKWDPGVPGRRPPFWKSKKFPILGAAFRRKVWYVVVLQGGRYACGKHWKPFSMGNSRPFYGLTVFLFWRASNKQAMLREDCLLVWYRLFPHIPLRL